MKSLEYVYEKKIWSHNVWPAGIDEAGRGPLAGPVVAAAVILKKDTLIENLNDSKKLSPAKRKQVYEQIMKEALAVSLGIVEAEEIDRINILQATLKAMTIAVQKLTPKPGILLIDGKETLPFSVPQLSIIGGDSKCASIAAASIVAKVKRDSIMEELHEKYPQYNFAKHKGYPTKEHIRALKIYGPSPVHRMSFKHVKTL